MQKVLTHHDFEGRIRAIHDHLYANANIRTNEGIAQELAKVLMALNYHAAHADAPRTLFGAATWVRDGQHALPEAVACDLHELFGAANAQLGRYPEGTCLLLDDLSLAFVRSKLHDVNFASGERDWLGDAIETIRSASSKRLGGQFFTDQRVTELSVALLEFDPVGGDDFVDISAGTGGFLLAAAKRLLRGGLSDHTASIGGAEIDPELARLANGNLASLAPSHGGVVVADSLASPETWLPEIRRRFIAGTHRCLASNPPFGTKITIKNRQVLERFDLAKRWTNRGDRWTSSTVVSPRPPDLLFIEQNLRLAEPGRGRVALVTPYQVLSGPQLGYVREWILRNARIRAVIDLSPDTFQPWTGTKTSLLVLERRAQTLDTWTADVDTDHQVFMSISSHIGHDRRGNPVLTSSGEIRTDLPRIEEAWWHFRRGGNPTDVHPDSFLVAANQITHDSDLRLNAAFYSPAKSAVLDTVQALADQEGWRLSTIGQEAERVFFPGRFKRGYVNDGVPFLGGTQITQLLPTNLKFLAPDNPRLNELLVEDGWILVTRSGSTGVVSSVSSDMAGAALSEHVIRIIPRATSVPGEYLEAYLRSSVGQALLATGIFGSVIDEITPEHVAAIPLAIPPADELSRIVDDVRRARAQRASAAVLLKESSHLVDSLMTAFQVGSRGLASPARRVCTTSR